MPAYRQRPARQGQGQDPNRRCRRVRLSAAGHRDLQDPRRAARGRAEIPRLDRRHDGGRRSGPGSGHRRGSAFARRRAASSRTELMKYIVGLGRAVRRNARRGHALEIGERRRPGRAHVAERDREQCGAFARRRPRFDGQPDRPLRADRTAKPRVDRAAAPPAGTGSRRHRGSAAAAVVGAVLSEPVRPGRHRDRGHDHPEG